MPTPEASPNPKARPVSRRTNGSQPSVRRSFKVRLARASVDSASEWSAHITPADDVPKDLAENNVRLGDAVMDIISDLLVELVRAEEGTASRALNLRLRQDLWYDGGSVLIEQAPFSRLSTALPGTCGSATVSS